MQNEQFKVALYIRVSTDRQAKEGDSLEEQESELKKFCEYRKYQIRNIYIERGKSGGNTNRPEYQKLLKEVEAQKINAVVVKKIDRLSRSLLDFEAFMKLLQEKDIEFISLKENFDTTSAMGKAMLRVALVFAQLEREQTSERLIDVFEYRASQGLYNGGARPLGYTNVNKELVPYPKERQLVELMFDKFLETKSTTQTARLLNETGFRNRKGNLWDKREIYKILQRPVYKGMILWNSNLHQGIHQPIISEKRFNEVQQTFKERNRIRSDSNTKGILQRLIFCGNCNSPMTPSHALNKIKIKYYYYRCTSTNNSEKRTSKCTIKYVAFKSAENRLLNLLLALSEQAQFSIIENKVLKHNQTVEQAINKIQAEINALKTKIATTKNKKESYLDSLILGDFKSLERERINKRIDEMELEEKQFKGKLYKQEFELNQQEEEKIDLMEFKKLLISFKADYEGLTREELREYLIKHIQKILYFPDKLSIKFRLLPYPVIFDA